jgi:hypothetical protein
MIPKKDEKNGGDTFSSGGGRPFEMPERYPIEKNDEERQRPIIIHLGDLNEGSGMPKNFARKAGRTLPSFTKYWTQDENEDLMDIQ